MKIYEVYVPFTAIRIYEAEADNEDEAKEVVCSGNGEPADYAQWEEDVDTNNWEVYEKDLPNKVKNGDIIEMEDYLNDM